MIVGITGYGCTGASAYIDLLKEYEGSNSYRGGFEFQLLQQVDGILDLKHYLCHSGRRLSTNAAIRRFINNQQNSRIGNIMKSTKGQYRQLTADYINSLITISWKGNSNYDPIDLRKKSDSYAFVKINKLINQVLGRINADWHWPPMEERYFSMLDEKTFDELTKKYINAIFAASGIADSKDSYIVMEQLFNTTHPLEGSEYFDDVRSIIVDRDPRDVYLLTNVMMLKRLSGYMPCKGDVKDFCVYYRALHNERSTDQRVRYVMFEDLVYDYEQTCADMSFFLGNRKQINKGQFFKPEYSINNTQLFKKGYGKMEDIHYIEKELADLLYPFAEKEKNINYRPKDVKPFHSQSRVNKQF